MGVLTSTDVGQTCSPRRESRWIDFAGFERELARFDRKPIKKRDYGTAAVTQSTCSTLANPKATPVDLTKRFCGVRDLVAASSRVFIRLNDRANNAMESLLSVGFDNISSRDGNKIRKGLRQIEGLLAQVCLSQPSSRSPHKRKSSALSSKQQSSAKKLNELKSDPAFREFFRIQEGFQWNGTYLS